MQVALVNRTRACWKILICDSAIMRPKSPTDQAVFCLPFTFSILLIPPLPVGGSRTILSSPFHMQHPISLVRIGGLRFALVTPPIKGAVSGTATGRSPSR